MSGYVVFAVDHPIALWWRSADGTDRGQRARLQSVSDFRLTIHLPRQAAGGEPAIGDRVVAEAPDAAGTCLTQFRGIVRSVLAREIEIQLDAPMKIVQRRAHPRARLPFGFTTVARLMSDPVRHFLAHPIDIGAGGVRLHHRLSLQAGERFRLTLRPWPDVTIAPTAEVIQCQPVRNRLSQASGHPTYVTRARFVDLSAREHTTLARFVAWLLQERDEHQAARAAT